MFRIDPCKPNLTWLILATVAWLVGLVTIFSLGDWSEFYPLDFIPAMQGMNIYVAIDFLAANILLLVGAMFTSVFFGWFVPKNIQLAAIDAADNGIFRFWQILVRFVIPPVLFVVLVMGLFGL